MSRKYERCLIGGQGGHRSKFAREVLSTFLFWCVKRGVAAIFFYLRENRNITADAVTRLAEEDLDAWETEKGPTRTIAPDHWWAFDQFTQQLDRGRVRMQGRPWN